MFVCPETGPRERWSCSEHARPPETITGLEKRQRHDQLGTSQILGWESPQRSMCPRSVSIRFVEVENMELFEQAVSMSPSTFHPGEERNCGGGVEAVTVLDPTFDPTWKG